MTSFVIGTVIEPEMKAITIKKTGEIRNVINFGLLSGKTCNQFDVWPDSKSYQKVSALKAGDTILAVVGASVDDKGRLQYFLNAVGSCSKDLRTQLLESVKN